ncbi:hypothetical protein [Gudongella sp. SC589]|uniref:hypothetical protein n=1 Tax=Gudongella sp. SC589 TaxID=3385990 RepID=UPI003904C025
MSKIVDRFKDSATEIDIPDFDGIGNITIKVQRPQLTRMMREGKIDNPLMSMATKAALGKAAQPNKDKMTDEELAKDYQKWIDFYCEICMVEPKFEEVKDHMTDDQLLSVYAWALAPISSLRSFRHKEKDGADNNDGKGVQRKAK